ncbi:hypothetical protein, partial [Flagellimonas pacifica]
MKKTSLEQFSSYGYNTLLFIAFTLFTCSFGFGQVPSGYTATIDQDPINAGNETSVGFTFAGAEIGSTY